MLASTWQKQPVTGVIFSAGPCYLLFARHTPTANILVNGSRVVVAAPAKEKERRTNGKRNNGRGVVLQGVVDPAKFTTLSTVRTGE